MRAQPRRMNSNVRASLIVSVPPLYGPPSGLRCCMLPFLLPAAKMLVQLRDGRKIIGIMRSFDQFANIVLEEAIERVIVGKRFADVPLGLYVIRGENVVLLGQIVRPPSRSYLFARDMFIHKLTYLPVLARAQDDAKEETTTKQVLTEAPIDELLAEKREAEEALRLKANLSRAATRAATDPWDELG